MRICFILPQMLKKPVGGYKMVYEYANRLSEEGHEVGILFLNNEALKRFGLPKFIRIPAVSIFTKIEPRWFRLNKKVKKLSSTERKIKSKLNDYNLAIATGVDTVDACYYYFSNAHKAYFIQGYEEWIFTEDKINKTYALGMDNIVVSSWLKTIVDKYAQSPSLLLRNPIDIEIYKCINPIENRDIYSIGVLYHQAENKGFKYAYEALIKLKKIFPEITVKVFGTARPNMNLPEWFEFKLNATQLETVNIYNSVSIFLCATVMEGFGLTGLEAMACGAALVSTDYEGVKEYAVDGVNSLLSSVCNADALVQNVEMLILNNDKRVRLASEGIKMAQAFSWENAMNILCNYIKKISLE